MTMLLCGCSADFNKTEIDEIDFIHILSIDYLENKIVLTAVFSESSNSGSDEMSVKTISGKGKNMFEAYEDLKKNNNKNISIAHTSFYLIGEDAGKLGLSNYIDYLSRDETIKMNAFVFVTKDMDASKFLVNTINDESTIHKDLDAINQKEKQKIKRFNNKISDLFNVIENNKPILIPYVIILENGFTVEGLSVFKDLKLYDYLDSNTSLGYNLLKNNIKTLPVYLDNGDGLLITNPSVKFDPIIINNKIHININLKLYSTIKEIKAENLNIMEEIINQNNKLDIIDSLSERQEDYINTLCDKAINYSISSGIDIFDIQGKVLNNLDLKDLNEEWKEIIKNINYNIKIKSQITRSLLL